MLWPMTQVEDWIGKASWLDVGGEEVAVIDVPASTAADGPPWLVIHGFPTSSIDFRPILDHLAHRQRVVLVDLPGYGLSAKTDRPYSLFGQADAVVHVVAELGLDEVDLLTHDMGDTVGGELLARSLEGALGFDVRRRVLTNGSIYIEEARLTDGQQFLLSLPDELLPADPAPNAASLVDAMAALCVPSLLTDAVKERLMDAAQLIVRDEGNRLMPRLIRYIEERRAHQARWTGAIETHPSPLTVIWGRHDPVAVPIMAERLVERRPDASLVWLDAGHWPMLEDPGAFADAVMAAGVPPV